MATIRTVAGKGTGSTYLDSLIWGGRLWGPAEGEAKTIISVWLGDPNELISAAEGRGDAGYFPEFGNNPGMEYWDTGSATTEAEPAVYTLFGALELYSSVCNLEFVDAASFTSADMVWWKVDLSAVGPGIVGIHETLGGGPGTRTQLWGYFNPFAGGSWNQQSFGGDGRNTIIHELGHAFGLAHPHGGGTQPDANSFPGVVKSTDLGLNGLNQSIFTVMSYNPGLSTVQGDASYGTQGGLGAFDIAALQLLYGKNMTTATGDNVYELPKQNAVGTGWMCIWDAGGDSDRISGRNATGAVTIDLRAATLVDNDVNAGGYISQQAGIAGGFTIAYGVVIENAEGGDFDDALIGNEAGNMLQGYKGADFIAGLVGNDILEGGDGDDTLEGGAGADQLYGGAGYDLASYSQATKGVKVDLMDSTQNADGEGGNAARDDTYSSIEGVLGSDFDDTISGTDAADLLSGGAGKDILTGRGGDDVYIVEGADDQIAEEANGGNDTIITSKSASLASFANCEALYAADGTAAINLTGAGGNEKLGGNDGANVLDGGLGADEMTGGKGNDTYRVDDAGDKVVEAANGGTADLVYSAINYTLAAFVEKLYASGSSSISLTGNSLSNTIKGNAGSNTIYGGAGNDTIYGGAGNDTIYGGTGRDSFVFNTGPSSRSNKDKIGDWSSIYDTVKLENAVFTALKTPGVLAKGAFVLGAKALQADDRVGYDKVTGNVWYDANGNKAGGYVAFTNIGANKKVFNTDFVVM